MKQTALAAARPSAVYYAGKQWHFGGQCGCRSSSARGDAPRRSLPAFGPGDLVGRQGSAGRCGSRRWSDWSQPRWPIGASRCPVRGVRARGAGCSRRGLYGVLSVSVAERTREIGVRSALGASSRDILALVLRQGMVLTAVGVALGLGWRGRRAARSPRSCSALAARSGDVRRRGGALLGVSALACWGPAWRAARLDPAITLRAE